MSQVDKIEFMINECKVHPDPYNLEQKEFGELSMKEIKELTIHYINMLGEDLNNGSDISEAMNWGLNDFDPEPYLKTCQELYICYPRTSPLGRMIGIHSIGFKLLWCKYGKVTFDNHLNRGFREYVVQYCNNCKYKRPRLEDWACKWKWFWDRQKPKPIEEFVENMKK